MAISNAIRQVRIKAGLSQSQLAEKIGVKQKDISRWETGARKPKLETLQKIANACNANIIDLVK